MHTAKELQMSLKCRMLKLRCFLHIKDYLFLFYVIFLPYFFVLFFPLSLFSFLFFFLLLFIVFSISLYLIMVLFSAFLSLVLFRFDFYSFFSCLVLLLSFRVHKKENRDISPSLTVCVENKHIQNQPHPNTFVHFTCFPIRPA
jgi:hypothetical protein